MNARLERDLLREASNRMWHTIDHTTGTAYNAPRITRSMRVRRWRKSLLWAVVALIVLAVLWSA